MPVNLLLCEGNEESADIRLLKKLLGSLCLVVPGGSSRGLRERIDNARFLRDKNANTVFAVRDRDFPKEWNVPDGTVLDWITPDHRSQMKHWGWIWPRKEIENYLIDPIIVQKALDVHRQRKTMTGEFDINDYRAELERARDSLATYQAARIALTVAGKPFYLRTRFGTPRGRNKYHFPVNRDEQSCEHGIKSLFEERDDDRSTAEKTLADFRQVLAEECSPGKPRYRDYLHAFAGKDFLWSMENWFGQTSLKTPQIFQEKVLTGIENAEEDITLWCSEWTDLVEKIRRQE